jgi:hypothetical protein
MCKVSLVGQEVVINGKRQSISDERQELELIKEKKIGDSIYFDS